MITNEQIAKLVDKVKTGDQNAFRKLYNETWKPMYYLLLKRIGDEAVAEELLQELYVNVYNGIGRLEDSIAFIAWCNKICHNLAIDYLRKKKFLSVEISQEEQIYEIEDHDDDFIPEKVLVKDEVKQIVLDVINSLPDSQKTCIIMFYYQNMSTLEISKAMGLTDNAVRKRLFDARKAMKVELEKSRKKEVIMYSMSPIGLFRILNQDASRVTKKNVGKSVWLKVADRVGIPPKTNYANEVLKKLTDSKIITNTNFIPEVSNSIFAAIIVINIVIIGYPTDIFEFQQNQSRAIAKQKELYSRDKAIVDEINDYESNLKRNQFEQSDNGIKLEKGTENPTIEEINRINQEKTANLLEENTKIQEKELREKELKEEEIQNREMKEQGLKEQELKEQELQQNLTNQDESRWFLDNNEKTEQYIPILPPTKKEQSTSKDVYKREIDITYEVFEVEDLEDLVNKLGGSSGINFSFKDAITKQIGEKFDGSKLGVYTLHLVSNEKSLKKFDILANVEVLDVTAPDITVENDWLELSLGNTYSQDQILMLANVTAEDNIDETVDLVITGYERIDFSIPDDYELRLNATDLSGNKTPQKVIIIRITAEE